MPELKISPEYGATMRRDLGHVCGARAEVGSDSDGAIPSSPLKSENVTFPKSIIEMKLQFKLAHQPRWSAPQGERLPDVTTDLIQQPEFLDSRFHGNYSPNHPYNSRLLSKTAMIELPLIRLSSVL